MKPTNQELRAERDRAWDERARAWDARSRAWAAKDKALEDYKLAIVAAEQAQEDYIDADRVAIAALDAVLASEGKETE